MDNKTAITSASASPLAGQEGTRRKRRSELQIAVRYFLPKPGSSATTPELGEEVASEGEALIQGFKSGQAFYTLAVWKAAPEIDGGGRPVIVKQAAAQK